MTPDQARIMAVLAAPAAPSAGQSTPQILMRMIDADPEAGRPLSRIGGDLSALYRQGLVDRYRPTTRKPNGRVHARLFRITAAGRAAIADQDGAA